MHAYMHAYVHAYTQASNGIPLAKSRSTGAQQGS